MLAPALEVPFAPPLERQLAMDGFAAVEGGHPMVGLLELDVGAPVAAVTACRGRGERVSLFSFVVHCIARAISEHPDLNLVRHGRRLVCFDDVDVSVPVEVVTAAGHFPRQVVIRRAQDQTAQEIFAQLEAARERYAATGDTSDEDRWGRRIMSAMAFLPRAVRVAIIRLVTRNAYRIKQRAGTTLVTSVGKFASIPGFAFSFTTGPRASTFAVGSVVDQPRVHAGQVAIRPVLSLAVILDHDLVDGGPAARFARRLQQLIETADGLESSTALPTAGYTCLR